MKIKLDFDQKIITVEDDVKLGEFIKKIKKVLPDYQSWTLYTNTEVYWGYYPIHTYHPAIYDETDWSGTIKYTDNTITTSGSSDTTQENIICMEIN